MNRQPLGVKEFLELFFGEVAAKFLRLKAFVYEQIQEVPLDHGKKLGASLSEEIDAEIVRTVVLFDRFSRIKNLSADDEESFFQQLQSFSDEFDKLHAALRWLPTPWPGDEIYAFTRGIFREGNEEELYRKLNGSISFTDIYNFFTYEVYRHLPGLIQKEKPVVWLLPKAEIRNALIWPIIVHEVAHDILSYYRIDEGLHRFVTDTTPSMLRWAVELAADLIAVRVLGPAYLFSFMSLAMFSVRDNLRVATDLHPSPYFRIEYMKQELQQMQINLEEMKISYDWEQEPFEAGKKYFSYLKQRLSLDNRVYPYYQPKEESEKMQAVEKTLGEKVKQAVEIVDATRGGLPLRTFSSVSSDRSIELAKRLREKALVASFRDRSVDIGIQTDIKNMKHNDIDKFREIRSKLNEKPSEISEIANAGWFEKLFRVSRSTWLAPKETAKKRHSNVLKQIREQYEESVSDLDNILQKSIEVSAIHFFFRRGFEELKELEKEE